MREVGEGELAGFSREKMYAVLRGDHAFENAASLFVIIEESNVGAESKAEVGVRAAEVGVDKQHTSALSRHADREIDGEVRFAYAALVGDERKRSSGNSGHPRSLPKSRDS